MQARSFFMPMQPQKLGYKNKRYYTIQAANNKGRLICAYVVRIWHNQVFSWRGSNLNSLHEANLQDKFLMCTSLAFKDLRLLTIRTRLGKQWRPNRSILIRIYTVCHSVCIFQKQYPMSNNYSNFLIVEFFRFLCIHCVAWVTVHIETKKQFSIKN